MGLSGRVTRRLSGVLAMTMLIAGIIPTISLGASAPTASGINLKALLHDTRSATYRSPFGAVPAGTSVNLSLRTAHNGAATVTLFVDQRDENGNKVRSPFQPLRLTHRAAKYDLWSTRLTPPAIGIYSYRFRVRKGKTTVWYSSTVLQEGGKGQVYRKPPSVNFELTAYDPSFTVPSRAKDAIIYQIFPDRFYNGDPTNDRSVMDPQYNNIHPVIHTNWSDAPLPGGSDFFGGDLQGVIDKLPYLKGLGINTLYLNPIFLAPSNHKYDTSDYFQIDPHFGSLDTFQHLVTAAGADGIRVLLDGVFNHTGSDSRYFNRYGHFSDAGAYQSKSSPYYSWYSFADWPTTYVDWAGYDTLPQLSENDAVKDFIFRQPGSVAQYWLGQGSAGWRLDSAQSKSHSWWQQFRQSVKGAYPGSMLIAEDTADPIDATSYLLGNEVDGVMNYRFRDAVLSFFARGNGTQLGLPATVTGMYNSLMSVLEEYPLPAIESSMNLVDSHDKERTLYDLQGNKQELRQVATLQMTWLGAPTIYYGDEVGLTGATDPDDRRTFPWGAEDTGLQSF